MATAIGAMLVISPLVVLLGAPIFFGVIWATKYVSLGSLAASLGGGVLLLLLVAAGWNHPVWLVYGVAAVGHRLDRARRQHPQAPLGRGAQVRLRGPRSDLS